MVYSFLTAINSQGLLAFLVKNGFAYQKLDMIDRYSIVGYIISPFLLLLSSHWYSNKKLMMFSLVIYLILTISIFNFISKTYIPLFFTILGAVEIYFTIALLRHIILDKKLILNKAISQVFVYGLLGYLIAELVLYMEFFEIKDTNFLSLIILNIFIIAAFIYTITSNKNFIANGKSEQIDFLVIIKHMELEAVAVFVVFYTLIAILNSYDSFDITNNLLILSLHQEKYYMIIAIMGFIFYFPKILTYNLYLINLVSIIILASFMLVMKLWATNIILNAVFWVIIAALLYLIFVANIIILSQKYQGKDLSIAFSLYCFVASIGFYAGDVTVDRLSKTLGESGFILSVSCALVTLLVYYFHRFKKDKLINW
ncbi:MAG: hypothetical protein HRU35_04290 [Rickettsiaceae bacterium]|nr:hypothetical protein [Rickettsiaceae bacterium]